MGGGGGDKNFKAAQVSQLSRFENRVPITTFKYLDDNWARDFGLRLRELQWGNASVCVHRPHPRNETSP